MKITKMRTKIIVLMKMRKITRKMMIMLMKKWNQLIML